MGEFESRRGGVMSLTTIIGRGHSGTRAISQTLTESGVFMGSPLNKSGDLVPAEPLYEACRIFARHVTHKGGVEWDFDKVLSMEPEPSFVRLVEEFLVSIRRSGEAHRGWKLPETTLVLPWILKMFPENHYIYWYRDPRDSILGAHLTDDLADFGIGYEPTPDPMLKRAISWKYQAAVMQATPRPGRLLSVRFEDFVLEQERVLKELESFLGIPMARLPVNPEAVGRWRRSGERFDIPFLKEDLERLGYS